MGDLLTDLAETTWKVGTGPASAGVTAGSAGMSLVGDAAKDAVGDAIESQAEEFLWNFAQSVVDGTQMIFHLVIDLLLQMTEPQVTGEFIYTMGGRIFFISLPLIVAFAAVRIIAASLRAQALTGARDAFVGAAASVLGTVALVPLTAVAVRAVDAVADGMIRATLSDGDKFVDDVMAAVVQLGTIIGNRASGEEVSGPIAPWDVAAGGVIATALICIAAGLLLLVACAVIGLALVARNMLLYIVIVVGSLCLSGLAWGPTRRWASIWMGWMVALIFTKLAIVVVMGLGVLAVTATIQSGEIVSDPLPGFTTVLSGILMLILAAFMPVACFALFGWMGEAGVRELQGAADGAQGMLTSTPAAALSASQTAGGRLSSLLGAGEGGSGSGKGGDAGLANAEPGGTGGATEASTAAETGGTGGAAEAATGTETGAATGAAAATGGIAAGAVATAEVGSKAKDAGEAVGEEVKGNIAGAVSETTDSAREQPYSWEQPAPGENPGDGGSAASAVADESINGHGPAAAEPAPVDATPAADQMPVPEPAPVPSDTGAAPEVPVGEAPPAPVNAPLEVPVTGENADGGK
ncbi:type IV secretion system protein [Brachybacterium vulturis]|uniref:type IV secretion system protein n=1 Tax=Brachybacterium vulturis TaxID=2017484 RepID=UPI003736EE39